MAKFIQDIHNVERETQTKADPALTKVLVENSRDAIRWLAENGAKLTLSFDQEPPLVDGIYKFSGGWVTHMLGKANRRNFDNITSSLRLTRYRSGQAAI